ncbi:MAG: hypothetical protein WBW85_16200 [Terriglobales bacterium]
MPINLLAFAITRYRRDFRKYLMRAAERSGGSALHVLFREKVTFSWADAERVDYSTSANSYALGQIIRERLQPGPILGLLGLGGTRLDKPAGMLAANLHQDLSEVHWVYDVFDDFLYNAEGEDRVRRLIADALWRCRCERSIMLDPGLRGRYPSAVISTTPRISNSFRPSQWSTPRKWSVSDRSTAASISNGWTRLRPTT